MRPLRLDLAGFTVFREPTTVDFTDADFFALVGPTGSGKSTVLDAICFALYGTVPRWNDRRAVSNALAPSSTEARVRLVFESAGARYVLTRVVRRDGKGNATTKGAALEALPAGFDLSTFDTGLSTEDIGDVIAGTPSEVDGAVADVVGLPFEQFTKCVVLPQGEFAAFLHAKPAQRQEILVKLLGLSIYGQIRERAAAVATAADARVQAADQLLSGLAGIDDNSLADAQQRVADLRELANAVDVTVPELVQVRQGVQSARSALSALDAEIGRLSAVRTPAAVDTVAGAAGDARAALAAAATAVAEAEDREEKLRAELAGAGNASQLARFRDAYAERTRLARQAIELTSIVDAADAEHGRAVEALDEARRVAAAATAELEAAREAYLQAHTADRATALRSHLRVGEPCPVCDQQVTALPDTPAGSAVQEAEAAGKAAKARTEAANRAVAARDQAARDLDRALTAARAQADQLTGRLDGLDAVLAEAPAAEVVERELARLAALQRTADEALAAVRGSRESQRKAAAMMERAEGRLRAAWRDFDLVRDSVAAFGPPSADRDDLAGSWAAIAGWAMSQVDSRRINREESVAALATAEKAADALRVRLADLFEGAGLPVPDDDGYARAAAVAVERAEAAVRRIEERRAEADRLREQRDAADREAQVARTLAGHLRANNFERWLLEEALDSLVDGASRTLRELTGGQYDLGHDKGEFFVVDHHDAGLRRAVRTLSGGETFQASLSLALALSEQLAGMSTAAASLESIVLDEGFGTLDAATLDAVAATLENLAARGDRMVGVVTHVAALADRIPVRFEVRKDARTAYVDRT
jgi:exonuclease SbcC